MTRVLPSGTVTFLFTDIEGSTRLLERIGGTRYAAQLFEHHALIRAVVAAHGGFEIGTSGDAFFVVFAQAADALRAAEAMQAGLAGRDVSVRIGIHTGEGLVADGDYVGLDVHKAARICNAAHGGQVVVSRATCDGAGADLRDLGVHRLKDLTAPERLFQLGGADFPPLRTLRQTNLPVQPTPMFGRQVELAALLVLARSNRLVTLTGAGGMGKTRLALELAAALADDYDDGAWWVPIAALKNGALVLPTIAQVLGVREGLTDYLAERRLLILLDNMEQVLDASPLIGELLTAAPGLDIIATSRERLALAAEQEFPISPLEETAATELFVSCARQLKVDFQPDAAVPEICRRLDGWPLALELASTHVKLMSTNQILGRLERRLDLLAGGRRDLPERHSTMRATLDWSYDLLSDTEQAVLRALAVFAGEFELEAAEAVGGAGIDDLRSLVDKSLLRQDHHGRFYLLGTIREYALERLVAAGESADRRRRHAEWFFAYARAADLGLRTTRQADWLGRLRADTDNLRAVLDWALGEDIASGIELSTTLQEPWQMWGQLSELIAWFERAFARPVRLEAQTRAAGLASYGWALFFSQEYERAEAALTESLALCRDAGDGQREASVLNRLGTAAAATGASEQARGLFEQALHINRRLGDRAGIALSLHLLGELLRDTRASDRGEPLLEEAVAIAMELGDRQMAMRSLHSLGDLSLDVRDSERATQRFREALIIAGEHGDERSQGYCLAGLACAAALAGDARTAGRLWAVTEGVEDRLKSRMLDFERARYQGIVAGLATDPGFLAGVEAGRHTSHEEVRRELTA